MVLGFLAGIIFGGGFVLLLHYMDSKNEVRQFEKRLRESWFDEK